MAVNLLSGEAVVEISPITESRRIDSLDVMRGISLFGILLMNIAGMGLPDPAYWDPSSIGGDTGWNLRVWMMNSVLFEGTMRGMFSILFGAGALLFLNKGDGTRTDLSIADAWYRRLIWLVIFGVVHAYVLLWPGEILYMYGLIGMFLFPFRETKAIHLFVLGVSLLAVGAALNLRDSIHAAELQRQAAEASRLTKAGGTVDKMRQEATKAWEAKLEKLDPSPEKIRHVVQAMQGGYWSAAAVQFNTSYWMESEFHYRYSYFDILSMMLIGMALFKWHVLQGELPSGYYALMVLLGYGIGIPVNWFETRAYMDAGFSVTAYYDVSVTYDLGRLTMVVGHVGVIMLFCKSGMLTRLRSSLAAVGRMALTNYVMHTLITTFVFVGLAQYGKWERYQLYFLVIGIWIFQSVVSPLWLGRFYFGPMEWLWRSLTYWRRQPLRRASIAKAASAS